MTATREHLAAFEALIEEHITLLGCTNDTARAAQLALCAQSAEPGQGDAVAIVCGSQVQWLPGAEKIPDRSPLYTSPAKPDAELVELRALLAGTNYSASGDCHNARVVAAAIARIDAKLAEVNKP